MKSEDLIFIAAFAIAGFLVWKTLRRPASAATSRGANWTRKLNIDNDGGWQYFSDGSAIAPNGDYYRDGTLIWKAQP